MVSEKWYTYKDGEKLNIIVIGEIFKIEKQRNCILDCDMNYTGIKYSKQRG